MNDVNVILKCDKTIVDVNPTMSISFLQIALPRLSEWVRNEEKVKTPWPIGLDDNNESLAPFPRGRGVWSCVRWKLWTPPQQMGLLASQLLRSAKFGFGFALLRLLFLVRIVEGYWLLSKFLSLCFWKHREANYLEENERLKWQKEQARVKLGMMWHSPVLNVGNT